MRDYTPKIAKADLKHGAYYAGSCRNASLARWDADKQKFIHWRSKFGMVFLEEICHPEDDKHFDVFVVEREVSPEEHPAFERREGDPPTPKEIPLCLAIGSKIVE